ncbi:hypothetical protein GE09DRAFT_1251374 [Coniochaeta sp. 2T2.1]|nr:hypothetical protein GE09DRAFT_1251374 [Coniochaeta sp. 2T2.1]
MPSRIQNIHGFWLPASSASSAHFKLNLAEDPINFDRSNGVKMSDKPNSPVFSDVSNAATVGEDSLSSESSSFKTAATWPPSSPRSNSGQEVAKYALLSTYLPNYYKKDTADVTDKNNLADENGLTDEKDNHMPNRAITEHECRLRPTPVENSFHNHVATHTTSSRWTTATDISTGYSSPDFFSPEKQPESSFKPCVDEPSSSTGNIDGLEHHGASQGGSRSLRPALQDIANQQPSSHRRLFSEDKQSLFRLLNDMHIDNKKQDAHSDQTRPMLDPDSKPTMFRPMASSSGFRLTPFIDEQPAKIETTPQAKAYEKMLAGFSPNYQGNIYIPRNRSANIPDNENCALFITALPPTVTITGLLATIRDTGRVYVTHINQPEPENGHSTCAAKIIFFERRAAERFYDRHILGGLVIPGHPGYRARITWNRIKSAAPAHPKNYTRVLLIAGPATFADPAFLTSYFKSKFDFEIDEVFDRGSKGDRRLIEYRFGSFRCQAESAKMALGREMEAQGVQVWFGPDPCDVNPAEKGFTSAGEAPGRAVKLAGFANRDRLGGARQEHPARLPGNWRQTVGTQVHFR